MNSVRNFFVAWFVTAAKREAILLVSCCVARSEELEVNQEIALDVPSLSSQSEHAKNIFHCFSIYYYELASIYCYLLLPYFACPL